MSSLGPIALTLDSAVQRHSDVIRVWLLARSQMIEQLLDHPMVVWGDLLERCSIRFWYWPCAAIADTTQPTQKKLSRLETPSVVHAFPIVTPSLAQ